MKSILTTEQTAQLLILMEKFKSMDQFSVFNLWNIKKVNKEELQQKAEVHTMKVAEQKDSPKFGGLQKKSTNPTLEDKDEDFDMALPNDDVDIHKFTQRRGEGSER